MLLLLLITIAMIAAVQEGPDVLTSLEGGNCTSPVQIEVFGVEIADCNGIFDSAQSVAYGTTASCFSWIDQNKSLTMY